MELEKHIEEVRFIFKLCKLVFLPFPFLFLCHCVLTVRVLVLSLKPYIRILNLTLELITDYSPHQRPYFVAYPLIGKSLRELYTLGRTAARYWG